MVKGLNQFFSYFGSKVSRAKYYPAPKYETIVEPFAGCAGYSCLYPHLEIKLFDLNPKIVQIWKYLIGATKQDILSLPVEPNDCKNITGVEKLFIGFWYGRSLVHPNKHLNKWGGSNKYIYSFWSKQVRQRIANQVDKIKHWTVENLSYEEIYFEKVTYFIDPPYQFQGNRYPYGSKYINYNQLAKWVMSLKGQKIVCEQEGANWLPFKPLYLNNTVTNKQNMEMIFTSSFIPKGG